jgi:hypothetical protein
MAYLRCRVCFNIDLFRGMEKAAADFDARFAGVKVLNIATDPARRPPRGWKQCRRNHIAGMGYVKICVKIGKIRPESRFVCDRPLKNCFFRLCRPSIQKC